MLTINQKKLKSENTVWHNATVTRQRREQLNKHKSTLIWFTGLSGSGKSTLAHSVEEKLHQTGHRTFVLDGDNVRHGLCSNLGFSDSDRIENIRRIGEMSNLFLNAGIITLAAFISPFEKDRKIVADLVGRENYLEIFCDCSLEVCEKRDVKGLYKKARAGLIKNYTGISSPYEKPNADLIVNTAEASLEESIDIVIQFLRNRRILKD
jgi:adenylylsulfate kinase